MGNLDDHFPDLVGNLGDRRQDPTVRITFGPKEDRFHMQLAIDYRAGYHVSRDKKVLAAAGDLMIAGKVKGCDPREFVRICGGS